MVKFEGTEKEFIKFLGPYIRNTIQIKTKKRKRELKGICQHCKNLCELQTAHKRGFERKIIISNVLKKYTINHKINCDINEIMKEILKEHGEDCFLFLCEKCHRQYDKVH